MTTSLKIFGDTAKGLAKNPLGIIALFIVLVYGIAGLVMTFARSLGPDERLPLLWFLVFFPVLVLGVFYWLVTRHFFPQTGPNPAPVTIATALAPGRSATAVLSNTFSTPFQGYVIAVCNFQFAYGYAFINSPEGIARGSADLSHGYLGINITDRIAKEYSCMFSRPASPS